LEQRHKLSVQLGELTSDKLDELRSWSFSRKLCAKILMLCLLAALGGAQAAWSRRTGRAGKGWLTSCFLTAA
jgi:hypothetical protein